MSIRRWLEDRFTTVREVVVIPAGCTMYIHDYSKLPPSVDLHDWDVQGVLIFGPPPESNPLPWTPPQ